MFKVELTEKAAADVELVMKWFHDHQATSAGRKWHETLSTALEKLERHPQRCAIAAESQILGEEIRELLIGRRRYRYRVLFQVRHNSVLILRIWHSSRDFLSAADMSEQ